MNNFKTATACVSSQYMHFPVAGMDNPIYLERVYCYELYHQLRVATGDDFDYSLGGEVDKARHPILSQLSLGNTKPDLLIHRPGYMGGNLVVIEVKSVAARGKQIRKDLHNLTSFVIKGQYFQAIYLVYGGTLDDFENFRKRARQQANTVGTDQIDLGVIRLYWHQMPGHEAIEMQWNAA